MAIFAENCYFWIGKNVFECVYFLTLSYTYFWSFCFLSFFRFLKQHLLDGICRISSIDNQPDIRYPAKPYLLLLQEFIKMDGGWGWLVLLFLAHAQICYPVVPHTTLILTLRGSSNIYLTSIKTSLFIFSFIFSCYQVKFLNIKL